MVPVRNSLALKKILLLAVLVLPLGMVACSSDVPAGNNASIVGMISVDAYWQKVSDTLALVQVLSARLDSAESARVEDYARFWEGVSTVKVGEDTAVAIDTAYLVRQLRARPLDKDNLEAHLQQMLAVREIWPNQQNAAHSADSLAQALRQQEIQERNGSTIPVISIGDGFLARIEAFLQRLFPNNLPDLRWIFFIISSIVLGVFAYLIFGRMSGGFVADVILRDANLDEIEITSDEAYTQAQTLSDAGNNRLAIRYLYLSALLHMEERHIIKYDRSKTNREYVQSVADFPELFSVFSEIVNTFDRSWYGFQEVNQETFERYKARINDLREQK